MPLLGGARYIFRGELASDGILYQEICNSLDSYCDCFPDHRSILIRRIRYLSHGSFVLDRVCIHVDWIWHRCCYRLSISLVEWTGWFQLQRSQCALTGQWKPRGFPQRRSHMSFLMRWTSSSSRVSHNVANKIGGGSTYLTGFGSVYHS